MKWEQWQVDNAGWRTGRRERRGRAGWWKRGGYESCSLSHSSELMKLKRTGWCRRGAKVLLIV
jgi:hypothetical protein